MASDAPSIRPILASGCRPHVVGPSNRCLESWSFSFFHLAYATPLAPSFAISAERICRSAKRRNAVGKTLTAQRVNREEPERPSMNRGLVSHGVASAVRSRCLSRVTNRRPRQPTLHPAGSSSPCAPILGLGALHKRVPGGFEHEDDEPRAKLNRSTAAATWPRRWRGGPAPGCCAPGACV